MPTVSAGLANPDLGLGTSGAVTGTLQSGVSGVFGFASDVAHANFDGGVTGLAAGLTNFNSTSSLAGGLDADVINKVTGGELNANALSGATAFATNLVADPSDVLAHPTDITNALTGAIGGTALPTNLADPTSSVSDTLHSVLANVPNPGAIGGLTGLSGLSGVTSGLTNATGLDAHDPLSSVTSHLPGRRHRPGQRRDLQRDLADPRRLGRAALGHQRPARRDQRQPAGRRERQLRRRHRQPRHRRCHRRPARRAAGPGRPRPARRL